MAANEQTTHRPAPPAPQPSRLVKPATVERCAQDLAAKPDVSRNVGKRRG